MNTLLADVSSSLTNTSQGFFYSLQKATGITVMFPSVFAFRRKRTSLMSFLTHLHRAGRRAFMVYWFFRTFTPPYYFSPTHTFFHFPFSILHSPPCPLRVLALRPLDDSSSTLFLFLVSATIKNTIKVLSLEVG